MLQWLGKMLGGGRGETPGIPEEWKQQLAIRLDQPSAKPPQLREGLAQEIAHYLLSGQPESVLTEAAQSVAVGQVMGVIGYGHSEDGGMYQHLDRLPQEVFVRWALLLDACAGAGSANRSGTSGSSSPLYFNLPPGARWAEVMLVQGAGMSLNAWASAARTRMPYDRVDALLQAQGHPQDLLLKAAFSPTLHMRQQLIATMPGYAQTLEQAVETIRPLMTPGAVDARLHVLKMLRPATEATLIRLAPELAAMTVATSRQVRGEAEPLAFKMPEAMVPELQRLAVQEKPEQRQLALRLLHRLGIARERPDWLDAARATAAADKSQAVQSLLVEWDSIEATGAGSGAAEMPPYERPTIDWAADGTPSDDALARFWAAVNQSIDEDNVATRKRHEEAQARGHSWELRLIEPFTPAQQAQLREALRAGTAKPAQRVSAQGRIGWNFISPEVTEMAETGELTPVSAMKMLAFFELAVDRDGDLTHPASEVFEALHERDGHPTLLELSEMMRAYGGSPARLLRNCCNSWRAFAREWPDEDVWPFLAEHVDDLASRLSKAGPADYSFDTALLFKVTGRLPVLPAPLVSVLFDLALGGGKSVRLLAQQALQRLPGKEERIMAALSDGQSETRAVAATWLARLRHAPALTVLETAVRKEKQDVAKGAMLEALLALGQPVERYLDRDALDKEAAKLLAKGLPKDLDWFPWSALPTVRWADNGREVPVDTLKWLLVQAVKQKSPEPNAVLRKYCGMFDPRDREALGQCVLDAWLTEDVRPIPPDEAQARAVASATATHQSMARFPQYYEGDPKLGKSVEEITAMILPGFLRQPAGSAAASKGLLAVASACAAERAAPLVQRYLKEWYGQRAAQGKALIAMLAWIEHPSATQLMLAVGSRFRTKSFQEEATRQAAALAERKGWTLNELADRTVPSAGFDEDGVMALSYGPRVFTARLLPSFKIELFNPDGKKIANLPDPRQDDDAEQARDAKKALSAAKKELKSIVELQTDRLYEALCTGRAWPQADWRDYLLSHPVLRHLVQRLVWVEVAPPPPADDTIATTTAEASASAATPASPVVVRQSFRPLDDGTLTDLDDNEVQLADDAHVRLAHDSLLGEDIVRAWLQHLADYDITPLFQQLGKGVYALPADRAKADSIKDFEGHLIETFALRGRATKLGYLRGPTEDGGWFMTYLKRFPTLGLEATIEFTGNPLPETNRTAALIGLRFEAVTPDGGSRTMVLSQVPAILLSECYNDLRLIASEGPGFDADWRKKSEY